MSHLFNPSIRESAKSSRLSIMEASNMASRNKLQFDGTLTCTLMVSSLEQSKHWYQQMLGFEHLYTLDERRWSELRSPVSGVTVGLSEAPKESLGGPSKAILNFGVQNLEETRHQLEDRGVRFGGPIETVPGVVKLSTFADPDGHTLMLSQSLQTP
jgi:predicted enzyme related to lactoylglutathione lyase